MILCFNIFLKSERPGLFYYSYVKNNAGAVIFHKYLTWLASWIGVYGYYASMFLSKVKDLAAFIIHIRKEQSWYSDISHKVLLHY